MKPESDKLNFLPDDYHDRDVRRRLTAAGVAILAVCAIATGVALYVSQQSLQHAKRYSAEVTQRFDQAVVRGEQVKLISDEREKLNEHARRLAALITGIPSSHILLELTNALPNSAMLTSVSVQSIPRPSAANAPPTAFDLKKAALEARHRSDVNALPEIAPTDIAIKMAGAADTNVAVSQFCDSLSHSATFRDVRLVVSEISTLGGGDKATTRRFQIEATLNLVADLHQTDVDPSNASVADVRPDAEAAESKETP